jgi:diaminopimelate epimerase
MQLVFSKYQGTGNDFILLNNLDGIYDKLEEKNIRFLCDRKFGIGADGLIRVNSHAAFPFEMEFFNPDGSKSFCGNGARCTVAFAGELGFDVSDIEFMAIDGVHRAFRNGDLVTIEMNDVNGVARDGEDYVLNTGSPHFIHFEKEEEKNDILDYGKQIRYSPAYRAEGINVNLVELTAPFALQVRTYERGVENETFSCGTGVTACALAASMVNDYHGFQTFSIATRGGDLSVAFSRMDATFTQISLTGPAVQVFNGVVNV